MYGKKAFSSHTTNHAIHLYNGRIWVCSQILLEVSVASPNTAATINFKFRLLIMGTVFDFTGQINVPDIKELGIHVVIQCLFTAHQFIYMIPIDLMKRLPVFNQRTDDSVNSCNIIFIVTAPCLLTSPKFDFYFCYHNIVYSFSQQHHLLTIFG